MNKLQGKIAVITGGNSGIGLATAKEFTAEGATVVISGRDQKTLDEAVLQIGGDTMAVRADVSKLDDIEHLFAETEKRFGKIDVLFVNAGIGIFKSFETVTESDFDEQMGVNLKGAYFTVQKALPLLNENASIVLTSSNSAHMGLPTLSIYAASKAALLSLAKSLSAELVGRGIRVNALSPGPVTTPIYGRLGLSPEAMADMKESVREMVPMKRFASPEEIAKAVLFLASSDSSFVLGAELNVDGGLSRL